MRKQRLIEHARVSTEDQELDLQIDALRKHGVPKDQIFRDKISSAKMERPGLRRCLAILKRGDTLIVRRLDRLGRSMRHLVTTIEDLREQGIGFRSPSDGVIDTTNASGEPVFNMFSALAQFERTLIQERTKAGQPRSPSNGKDDD